MFQNVEQSAHRCDGGDVDTTLMKGLRVLECLVRADKPLGISAVAAELKLQKSNVHRTLATLIAMRYVTQDASGLYRPTLRIWEQGARVIARDPVRRAALSFMQALHQESSETVSLVVLDGAHCLWIHQIVAPIPVRLTSHVGQRAPAIYPAAGKALLAYQPDVEKRVKAIATRYPESKRGRVKIAALLAELATVRRTGCAYSEGDWREGVNGVASAIVGADAVPVAALALSGPSERMDQERMKSLSNALLNACTHIGNALGAS